MVGIVIQPHRERQIEAKLVRDLYQAEGWWPDRSERDIASVLNAAPAVGAWDGEQLIGFARAVTDGVFHAYLEDVVIREPYRRRGIGDALVRLLLEELGQIHLVTLFCKQGLVPFYDKQGFQPTKQVVMHAEQRKTM